LVAVFKFDIFSRCLIKHSLWCVAGKSQASQTCFQCNPEMPEFLGQIWSFEQFSYARCPTKSAAHFRFFLWNLTAAKWFDCEVTILPRINFPRFDVSSSDLLKQLLFVYRIAPHLLQNSTTYAMYDVVMTFVPYDRLLGVIWRRF
jgi:hypothetical protein